MKVVAIKEATYKSFSNDDQDNSWGWESVLQTYLQGAEKFLIRRRREWMTLNRETYTPPPQMSIHPNVQYTWYIISQVSLNLPSKIVMFDHLNTD